MLTVPPTQPQATAAEVRTLTAEEMAASRALPGDLASVNFSSSLRSGSFDPLALVKPAVNSVTTAGASPATGTAGDSTLATPAGAAGSVANSTTSASASTSASAASPVSAASTVVTAAGAAGAAPAATGATASDPDAMAVGAGNTTSGWTSFKGWVKALWIPFQGFADGFAGRMMGRDYDTFLPMLSNDEKALVERQRLLDNWDPHAAMGKKGPAPLNERIANKGDPQIRAMQKAAFWGNQEKLESLYKDWVAAGH